jgi:4'-phosphopantetheinyl transferase
MTLLLYHFIEDQLNEAIFEHKLQLLSAAQREKIKAFRRWQDAHCSLWGNLLLLEGLKEFGVTASLQNISYSQYGKPYLPDCSIAFNISHAGNCVVCVLSTESQAIGIDVEAINDLDIHDFKSIWTAQEWQDISNGGIEVFYRYWTSKEAIIKADGRGLSMPLDQIEVRQHSGHFQDQVYYLNDVSLHPQYIVRIASLTALEEIKLLPVKDQ